MGNISEGVQSAKVWWKSNTVVGMILFIIPTIVKLINPELTIDASAGADEVFNQANQLAEHADAAWVVISNSLGSILVALGIRKAAGGTPLKVK
jgi:hypothetical protein